MVKQQSKHSYYKHNGKKVVDFDFFVKNLWQKQDLFSLFGWQPKIFTFIPTVDIAVDAARLEFFLSNLPVASNISKAYFLFG